MTTRDELIAGLRDLADWYEQHPDVPLMAYPEIRHCVMGDDTTGTAELRQIAAALGAKPEVLPDRIEVRGSFAGLSYWAFYNFQSAVAEYVARQKIADAATPEQLAAVDGAA